jgi:SAM-dependent methyltransferase
VIKVSQNIWTGPRVVKHRQRRRAELVTSYLRRSNIKIILDIGCAEGYATSFFSSLNAVTCAIEIDLQYIRIAKKYVKKVDFVNASIEFLPFRTQTFDAVCILEVLEHLPSDLQLRGLQEADRILKQPGSLIISIPHLENIIRTKCIHCGELTPLYGHLHSMDESFIAARLPNSQKFALQKKYRLPNIQMISCRGVFETLPLRMWLLLNDILGLARKGYWIVLDYTKS